MQQGGSANPDDVARDFVQLVDDLAYAKTFYPTSKVTRLINSLASRIYLRIYQNRKEESNVFTRFWKYEVPLAIGRYHRIMLFSAFVFILFYLLGFFSAEYDPEFTREVMGDQYVRITEKNISEGNPFGIYQSGNPFISWIGLMIHNIKVALLAFMRGILLGVLSIYDLIRNAMVVGVFHYMFASKGLGIEFIFAVMIHGLLELTAIVIACGAGVVMGTSYLFPGTVSRLEAFKRGAKDGVKIVIGLIPVFVIAAFFEGFITGLYKMHIILNILILTASGAFVFWYFIIYPVQLKKRFREETLSRFS